MGDRAAQNEAARLDADDLVHLHAGQRLHELIDRLTERAGVGQKGRNVPKQDPGLGMVRNRADGLGEKHGRKLDLGGEAPSISHSRPKAIDRKPPVTRARTSPPSWPASDKQSLADPISAPQCVQITANKRN